jgi:hypothetical protein
MLSASRTIKLLDFPPHNKGSTELDYRRVKNPYNIFLIYFTFVVLHRRFATDEQLWYKENKTCLGTNSTL